jgi:SOUL heme-binding protein
MSYVLNCCRYYSGALDSAVRADGLVPAESAASSYTVAQYNAIYSLSKRRNEVWVPLQKHDWEVKGF